MAKLKDGYYKQTAEAIGSDLHVLLAGGGSKALSDFAYKSDLTGFVTGGPYLPLSGGNMNGDATIKFTTYGNRFLKISGNSLDFDYSTSTGGWAGGIFLKDSVGIEYSILQWNGGVAGLNNTCFNGGNIGIGTTNPAYKLDVNGSGRFGHILLNKGYGSNVGESTIEMDSAGATLWMQYYHNGGINMCAGGGTVTMGGALSVKDTVTMSSTFTAAGGTISNNARNLLILHDTSSSNSNRGAWIKFSSAGSNNYTTIGLNTTTGTFLEHYVDTTPYVLKIDNNGVLYFRDKNVLHAGNISSYALTSLPAHNHSNIISLGNKSVNDLPSTYPNGLSTHGIYNDGWPFTFGCGITAVDNQTGSFQIAGQWNSSVTSATDNDYPTEMYIRGRRDSYNVWQTWTRVLTNRNYNSYSPKLDGTGAIGTWGISISGNADTVDNKHASDFMPASGSYINGTTVADVKANLLNYFRNKPATTSAYTSSTFVGNFGNDSYTIESSSVCGWIALNPGYDNYNHGHFLVSEYGNNRLKHVGLGYNTWYGPYTIAYTSDIPTVTNYYWANVKISDQSSTSTNPTFNSAYASFMELSRTTDHGLKVGSIRGTAVGSRTGQYIHMYERVHIGSPNGWGSNDAPSYGLSTYGGAWLATDTGNVGIGTTNPLTKLHLVGNFTTSGDIYYTGSLATSRMIRFLNNTADAYGNGIEIGGGGLTVVGGGEAASLVTASVAAGVENLVLCADEIIEFYSNCQSTLSDNYKMVFDKAGDLTISSSLRANGVYANRSGSTTSGGVSLYSDSDPMTYGIAFRGTATYGTHGYVTAANDWATYLTMNDSTTRGWIFRRHDTNVASIAGNGNMAIGQYLEFSNSAHIATNRSSDYHYGYTFNLGDSSNSIGMYSGAGGESGGVIVSPDTCLIYNSSDTGYNLQVRDKDLGGDLTNIATLTFGIEQSGYYAWSRGGFKKNGSDDSYVLLGGGGHKAESSLSVNYANYANSSGSTAVWSRTWQRGNDALVDPASYHNQTRVFMVDSDTANKPSAGAGFIIAHSWDWGGGGALLYQDFDMDYGRLYTNSKQCDATSYTGWKKVAWTSDIPTKLSQLTDDVVSGKYLALSGGSMNTTAKILAYTPAKGTSDIYNSAIELREATASTTSCTDNMYDAPGITFHWGGWWVHKLNLHTNDLYWDNNKVWHTGNDGSGSGLDADLLDGYHASYASNKPYGTIPVITTSGYMDVGRHFEFHYDNTTGSDYSTALMCTGNYNNVVNLPSASGTLALTSQIPTSLPANGGTATYYTGGPSSTYTNVWDCNAPDRIVYSDYGSSGRSVSNAPSGWSYGTLLELGHMNYRGQNGYLNMQLMWDVAHNTTNGGTLWFRGNCEKYKWAKNWCKVLSDQNYSYYALPLSGGWMNTDAQIYFRGLNQSTTAYATIGYRASLGSTMHHASSPHQDNGAFYIGTNGCNSANDWGGLAIDNEGVTVFGAGDTGSVFRVLNEDNVSDGAQFLVTKASGATTKYKHKAQNFESTVATGTQPYACTSTTCNTNLNADMLDGYHASSFYIQGRGAINAQVDLQTIPKDASGGWMVTNSGWFGMVAVLAQGHNASNRAIGFLFKGGQSSRVNLLTQVDNTWGDRGVIAYTSDIPSVGNGTITIKQNGSLVGSFTTNQSSDATFDLTGGSTDTNYYPTRSYTSGLQISSYVGSTDCQLYVPNAGASQAGVVSTGTQTFAGAKTFSGAMTVNNTITFGEDDDYGIRPITDNYCRIGASGKAFYQAYVTTVFTNSLVPIGTGSNIGITNKRYSYGYFSQQVHAAGGFYESSDERLKRILNPVKVSLDDLSKLRKIYYLWNDKPEDGRQLGMIAQDVQRLYPELVSVDSETGYLSLAYDKLSVLALEAIDVLYKEHKKLKERVDELEKLLTNRGIL